MDQFTDEYMDAAGYVQDEQGRWSMPDPVVALTAVPNDTTRYAAVLVVEQPNPDDNIFIIGEWTSYNNAEREYNAFLTAARAINPNVRFSEGYFMSKND